MLSLILNTQCHGISMTLAFQDLIMHFCRKYELNEDHPDFLARWLHIQENENFKVWSNMYKQWNLWEGVIYNKINDSNINMAKNNIKYDNSFFYEMNMEDYIFLDVN